MDLMKLNDIVNEAEVIVMPGQLRNSTTPLILVTGKHLDDEKYWAIFPSIFDSLNSDELAVYTIIVHNLYPVMRTTPIGNILAAVNQCNIPNSEEIMESLKQSKFLKEVAGNYFINHNGVAIASNPHLISSIPTPQKSAKIIPFHS